MHLDRPFSRGEFARLGDSLRPRPRLSLRTARTRWLEPQSEPSRSSRSWAAAVHDAVEDLAEGHESVVDTAVTRPARGESRSRRSMRRAAVRSSRNKSCSGASMDTAVGAGMGAGSTIGWSSTAKRATRLAVAWSWSRRRATRASNREQSGIAGPSRGTGASRRTSESRWVARATTPRTALDASTAVNEVDPHAGQVSVAGLATRADDGCRAGSRPGRAGHRSPHGCFRAVRPRHPAVGMSRFRRCAIGTWTPPSTSGESRLDRLDRLAGTVELDRGHRGRAGRVLDGFAARWHGAACYTVFGLVPD